MRRLPRDTETSVSARHAQDARETRDNLTCDAMHLRGDEAFSCNHSLREECWLLPLRNRKEEAHCFT